MKMKRLFISFFCLIAITISSCKKTEEEILGGDVPFMLCPRFGEAMSLMGLQYFRRGEVYLFKDSLPIQSDIPYIYYFTLQNSVIFRIHHVLPSAEICNFPDFAKEWENGSKIYIEGTMYGGRPFPPSLQGINFYQNYVLTKITKRK